MTPTTTSPSSASTAASCWCRATAARVGDRLRCRIAARDVALTLERQAGGSALNQLQCRIVAVADADHPSQCLVQLDAGGTLLVARITRRSWRALELSAGREVWAQVKAVALGA